jgi:hypothetical protein
MSKSEASARDFRRARRALPWVAAIAAALIALPGCETDYVTIAPDVGAATKRLGPAEGSASSHLALAYPVELCFIPWGWDARAQAAYGTAVAAVPGATALGDVSIEEDWTWWLLGTSRRLTVRGQAVKP